MGTRSSQVALAEPKGLEQQMGEGMTHAEATAVGEGSQSLLVAERWGLADELLPQDASVPAQPCHRGPQ